MTLRRLTSNYTKTFKPPRLRLSLSKQTWALVRVRWTIRSGKRGKPSLDSFGKLTNAFQSKVASYAAAAPVAELSPRSQLPPA